MWLSPILSCLPDVQILTFYRLRLALLINHNPPLALTLEKHFLIWKHNINWIKHRPPQNFFLGSFLLQDLFFLIISSFKIFIVWAFFFFFFFFGWGGGRTLCELVYLYSYKVWILLAQPLSNIRCSGSQGFGGFGIVYVVMIFVRSLL